MPRNTTINYQKLTTIAIKTKFLSFALGIFVTILAAFVGLLYLSNVPLLMSKRDIKKKGNVLGKTLIQKNYVVKEGDDLWKISENVYGSGFNGYDIAVYNKIPEPYILSTGQVLKIPVVTQKRPTQGETSSISTSQVTFNGGKYIVQLGDDLGIIAQKVYGDPEMWLKIAQANNLTNPNIIEVGTVLNIPR